MTQDQRNEIAARIRDEMARQGLDNVRLARKANVSDKTISRLINAKRDPRYNTIEQVAKALGLTEAELRGPPPAPLGLVADAPESLDDQFKAIQRTLQLMRAENETRHAELIAHIDERTEPIQAAPPRRRRA